jgi:hypothetical protein
VTAAPFIRMGPALALDVDPVLRTARMIARRTYRALRRGNVPRHEARHQLWVLLSATGEVRR